MSRSKSIAFMLLFGAVLLGGVLGFTADRVMRPPAPCVAAEDRDRGDRRDGRGEDERAGRAAARQAFADTIGLDAGQRVRLDSLLDARNERIDSLEAQVRPQIRAVHDSTRTAFRAMLAPDQLARYEAMRARDDSARAARRGGDRKHEQDDR